MKRIITITILALFTMSGFSQLFRPVPLFPTTQEKKAMLLKGIQGTTHAWHWRIDGTIAIQEYYKPKGSNAYVSETFSGVGIAIGYQSFVPKSETDPTPVNNYGFSAGIFPSNHIKFALAANVWEYFKFGMTYTLGVKETRSPAGFFVGTGITF